jgi:hypothetical protein
LRKKFCAFVGKGGSKEKRVDADSHTGLEGSSFGWCVKGISDIVICGQIWTW